MLYDRVLESSKYIKESIGDFSSKVAIILGTGLGALSDSIVVEKELSYSDIPGFVESTVESHSGKLIFGKLNGINVIAMQGRFHFYEGYSMSDVTFPVRVFKELGVKNLIVSNAAGGINPKFNKSDVMVIDDFVAMFIPNPLVGENDPRLGDRFPDMSEPLNEEINQIVMDIALENKIYIQKGVYFGVTGPSLETKAEYKMIKNLGGDVVGMSTIPEIIVANQCGLKVTGLSVVTDLCIPETLEKAELADILEAAAAAEPKLVLLISELVTRI